MALVAAKCINCGAALQIEHTKDAGICPHCQTAFITEKVINNYNVTNFNYNTQNIVKNIYGREKPEVEEYIKNGDVFISLGSFSLAKEQYELAIKLNPADWRGWFGMLKFETKNLEDYSADGHKQYLNKAKAVASPSELIELLSCYEPYERKFILKKSGFNNSYPISYKDDFRYLRLKIVNSALPLCPFCNHSAEWFMDDSGVCVCGNCLAKFKIKFSFTNRKIQSTSIMSVGTDNINNMSVGTESINNFLVAQVNSNDGFKTTGSSADWIKKISDATPMCQFCGQLQNLSVKFMLRDAGLHTFRCSHCFAEFKCEFSLGGKVKAKSTRITALGKVNQNCYQIGACDAVLLIKDNSKIK